MAPRVFLGTQARQAAVIDPRRLIKLGTVQLAGSIGRIPHEVGDTLAAAITIDPARGIIDAKTVPHTIGYPTQPGISRLAPTIRGSPIVVGRGGCGIGVVELRTVDVAAGRTTIPVEVGLAEAAVAGQGGACDCVWD